MYILVELLIIIFKNVKMIIKTDSDYLQNYLSDASNLKGRAEKLYIPENIDEINKILKECYLKNEKLTISAGGTGTTGSRIALSDSILSVEKLNNIIDFDAENHTVTVEPGVIVKDLQDFLDLKGFIYPPNPTETSSFVSGNVATNASGARTFKYGSTRDFVMELDVVLADGDEMNIKRGDRFTDNKELKYKTNNGKYLTINFKEISIPNTTKSAAGYFIRPNMDLIDLLIGSEGTLCVFKKIKLKLIPKPKNEIGLVIFFKSENYLHDFVSTVRDKSKNINDIINARLIEYFDEESLALQRLKEKSIPYEAKAAIWVEQEYDNNEEEILENWYEIASKYSDLKDDIWIAMNENEKRRLYEFRHALPMIVDEKISQMNIHKISLDTCVNNDVFRNYIQEYDNIIKSSHISYCKWGHIGDSHIHTNIFPKNKDEYHKSLKIYDIIIDKTLEVNGTISAEHGIGKIKKNYLLKMLGIDTINYFKEIKQVFDNKSILNNNNIFD